MNNSQIGNGKCRSISGNRIDQEFWDHRGMLPLGTAVAATLDPVQSRCRLVESLGIMPDVVAVLVLAIILLYTQGVEQI